MTEKQLAKACLEVQYMHLGKLWRGHPKRWFSQGIPPKWPSLSLRNYSNLPSLTKKRRRQHIFLQPRNAWTCPGRTCPIQHFRIIGKVLHSLKLTAKPPENRPFKTKRSYSKNPFPGALAVSFCGQIFPDLFGPFWRFNDLHGPPEHEPNNSGVTQGNTIYPLENDHQTTTWDV